MSELSPVPRDRLGEYTYRGLWWAIVALPAAVVALRVVITVPSGTFFLYAVVGIPTTIVLQVIAGLLAWSYRKRQWRHFLGRVAAVTSLVYYGLWLLLSLTVPESTSARDNDSLVSRGLGHGVAEGMTATLLVLIPLCYLALLVAIVVEGGRAVRGITGTAARPSGPARRGRHSG